MKSYAIEVENLSKEYRLYRGKRQMLRELLLFGKSRAERFVALRNVSLNVEKGEVLGIIGRNGSGKSTLSKIIAGIVYPSDGAVRMDGEPYYLAPSAGLMNRLTGRENIYFKCRLLGFEDKHIKSIEESIVEFAELGEFIDQPVRTYSNGMRSKLGFAISVMTDADILIIDESLSVGDMIFAQKCVECIRRIAKKGKTIVFISHSIGQVKDFCTRVIWMDQGRIVMDGPPGEVTDEYRRFTDEQNRKRNEQEAGKHA